MEGGYAGLDFENLIYARFEEGRALHEFLEKNDVARRMVDRAIAEAQDAFTDFMALSPADERWAQKCLEIHAKVQFPYQLLSYIDTVLREAAIAMETLKDNEEVARNHSYND